MAQSVWLVELEEYDHYGVELVAATKETAIELMKASYSPDQGYRVRWEVKEHEKLGTRLIGHFEAVPGLSTQHTATFSISEYEVEPAPGGDEG